MVLSDFSVKHPAIIAILLISLIVFGVIATSSLNTEMLPPVGLPMAVIVTIYPGASATEIERDISQVIENEMSTLPDLNNISSSSSDSYSTVTLEFNDKTDVNAKLPNIREHVNSIITKLPSGIQGTPQIIIYESSSLLPIMSVKLTSSMDEDVFTNYVETRVSPALARIEGVSKIDVIGGIKKEARVTLNVSELESHKVSALTIYQALQYNNINLPAGNAIFQSKQLSFTTSGAFTNLQDLGNIPIGFNENTYIYLKDVANIELISEPRKLYVRSQNKNCIMINVLKRQDGDILGIVKNTRKILSQIENESSGALKYSIITNQGEMTTRSLNTVLSSAGTGLILTIIVILLTLQNVRATIIISLSIPLSILFSLIGLYATGHSLNLLSLSGMTVAIGMIVDNSIVVLETTFKKFKDTNNRKLAAITGADEVGSAVLASTTTTICVFVPLLFLTGIIGIIMKDLSYAIVFALGASALVSVILVPWLSSLILKKDDNRSPLAKKIGESLDNSIAKLENGYKKLLSLALKNKLYVIILSISLLVASVLLLTTLKISFLPATDTGEFELHIETPSGYTLEQTRDKVDVIAQTIRNIVPEIEDDAYYVGSTSSFVMSTVPNKAYANIRLVPSNKRKRSVHKLIPLIQSELAKQIPDCSVTVLNGGFDSLLALGTGGQGFRMEIYGTDLDSVSQTAEKVRKLLAEDEDVVKAELSVRLDNEQLYTNLSQEFMGSLGVTPYEAGVTSRILFSGMEAGTLRIDDKNYKIRVVSDIAEDSVDDNLLNKMSVVTQDGRTIRFAAFSELEVNTTLSSITRQNRNFSIDIIGYLVSEDQSAVSARMDEVMKTISLPYGVSHKTAGTSELIGNSMVSLVFSLSISLFLVYVIMVIQFEKFLQPLIIMASIPFCLIGVILGLNIFGSSLSIIAMLALITLGGTVVNNAIVMVDYINQLRKQKDITLIQAIIDGATNRLRPIIMTSLTTVFGVLPMALAHSNGSEIYAPLGQAIFGGMITSTMITLIIIPVIYASIESRLKSKKQKNENKENQDETNN